MEPVVSVPDSELIAERRLYQAIIIQALMDATRQNSGSDALTSATAAARAFFEGRCLEPWLDFETICDLADFDSEQIKSFYRWTQGKGATFNRKRMLLLMGEYGTRW